MEDLIRISVIGGSASTAFALPSEDLAWPKLLERSLSGIRINHQSQGFLTMSQSIEILSGTSKSDILILHFGTSVGWASSVVEMGLRMGLDFHNEAALHQPPHKYSGSLQRKLKKNMKLRARNLLKYLLFFAGAYKPRTSIREVEDQVRAVLSVATNKAPNVIWMQHQSLQSMRIVVERMVYARYYHRLIKAIEANSSQKVRLVELGEEFLVPENYLLDGIHLTEIGHKRIAEKLQKILSENY